MSSSSVSKIACIQEVIDKTYTPAPHTSTSGITGITDQDKNMLVSKQRLQSAISLGLYAYLKNTDSYKSTQQVCLDDIVCTYTTGGIPGVPTVSPGSYDPDKQLPDTTVTYEEDMGKPKVTKDASGNVTSYEFTDTSGTSTNGTSHKFDTGVVVFDGKDFTVNLYALFSQSANNNLYYPTILSAMDENAPYYGFIIRWEYNKLFFVVESDHYEMSVDSSNRINVTITYKNKTITVTNNNVQVCSFTYDKSIDGLKFTLGCAYDEKGNPMRYAIATVYSFSIDKTA